MAHFFFLVVGVLAVQTVALKQGILGTSEVDFVIPSPCAPTAEQRDVLRPKTLARRSRATSFYLHDHGHFNFSDLERCYIAALGTDDLLTNIDAVADPNTAQHSTDILLLRQLRKHPSRVSDPKKAHLHIIGSPIGASYHAAMLPGKPCGGLEAHYQRVRAMLQRMQNHNLYKKDPSNWVLIDTDWDFKFDVLPRESRHLFETAPMSFATVDRKTSSRVFVTPRRTVVMPYNAHGLLDQPAKVTDLSKRSVSFYFHGTLHRKHEGSERSVVFNITEGLKQTFVEGGSIYNLDLAGMVNLSKVTARQMRDSVFCLVPAGDTPSSRRLFDALAAGCVPIILNDPENMPDLPFRNTIRWDKIALFGGSLDCVVDNVGLVKAWLQKLWHHRGGRFIRGMHDLGRQVFMNTLSYRYGDVGSAMLVEAGRHLNPLPEVAS